MSYDPSSKLIPKSVADDYMRVCREKKVNERVNSSGPVQYPGQIHQIGSLSGPGKKRRK